MMLTEASRANDGIVAMQSLKRLGRSWLHVTCCRRYGTNTPDTDTRRWCKHEDPRLGPHEIRPASSRLAELRHRRPLDVRVREEGAERIAGPH